MTGPRRARSIVVFSIARALLLLATLGLLWLAGARGLLLLALGVLVSGLLSYWLLARQRDAMSIALVEWSRRTRERMDSAAAKEDAADDERRSGDESRPTS